MILGKAQGEKRRGDAEEKERDGGERRDGEEEWRDLEIEKI